MLGFAKQLMYHNAIVSTLMNLATQFNIRRHSGPPTTKAVFSNIDFDNHFISTKIYVSAT